MLPMQLLLQSAMGLILASTACYPSLLLSSSFLPIGIVYLRMTMQTPSHLSLCSPGRGSSVRDTTPMSGSPGGNACGIQTDWEVGQRVFRQCGFPLTGLYGPLSN